MDFDGIKAAVLSKLDRSDLDGSKLGELTNDAQRMLFAGRRFTFLEQTEIYTTVNGTQSYALPLDGNGNSKMQIPLSVFYWKDNAPYRELQHYRKALFDRLYIIDEETPTAAGEPWAYTFWKELLWFFPVPSTAYSIYLDYYAKLANLVSGTDTNYLTIHFPNVLIDATCGEVEEFSGDDEAAKVFREKALATLRPYLNDDIAKESAQWVPLEMGFQEE